MYSIYQIRVNDEIHNYVNSNDRGHMGAAEKYPLYEAKLETQHKGSKGFQKDHFQHYIRVAKVRDFEGGHSNKLEEVFRLLNGYYDEDGDNTFDRFVTDYEVKQFTKEDGTVVEYRDMHSLSVGDIVRDHSTDTYHIVDSFGFKEVDVV